MFMSLLCDLLWTMICVTIYCFIVVFTKMCFVVGLTFKGRLTMDRADIVFPSVVLAKGDGPHPYRVLYKITTRKKTFLLSLRRNKNLLSETFQLDFGNGKLGGKESQQSQCYYQGRLKNDGATKRRSRVTVSTCDGLHGVFEDSHYIYYIVPRNYSNGNGSAEHQDHFNTRQLEHVLYNMTEITGLGACTMNCKTSEAKFLSGVRGLLNNRVRSRRDSSNSSGNKTRNRDLFTKTKYLELYLVNDYSMYLHYGKNATFLEHRSKLIANILDTRFRPLKIRVVLVGVEVWTGGDRFVVKESALQTLLNFLRYRSRHINRRHRNDNAQLITRKKFDKGTTAGKAPISTICSWRYSGGVNQDTHDNPLYVATVIAHELGHNLGMQHDPLASCSCNDHTDKKCIMSDALDASVRSFSSCSKRYLEKTLQNGQGHCLFDFPKKVVYHSVCGNGIVETGEECDCGKKKNCSGIGDCCNPDTCMFRHGAVCSTGECCENCRFKTAGTRCRENTSTCDLPEFCTGFSGRCPKDVHIQNGYPCSNGTASCLNGTCLSHDNQCRHVYGNSSRASHPFCYLFLNSLGSESGNCGKDGNTFKKCLTADAMCGSLQCSNAIAPVLNGLRNLQLRCLSSSKDITSKIALVRPGTKCADGKVCMNQQCVSTKEFHAFVNIRECPVNCSERGVCNSNNNCHCYKGWAPPYCDRPGNGGSIDSGQPMSLSTFNDEGPEYEEVGKPLIALITVGLVCAIVFALVITRFSCSQLLRTMRQRERQSNRVPRGELLDILQRH